MQQTNILVLHTQKESYQNGPIFSENLDKSSAIADGAHDQNNDVALFAATSPMMMS